jgi:hypothetical protein
MRPLLRGGVEGTGVKGIPLRVLLLVAAPLLFISIYALTQWRFIVEGYYLFRLQSSPYFVEALGSTERASLKWAATQKYVTTEKGAQQLIIIIVSAITNKLGKDAIKGLTEKGPAVLLIQASGGHEVDVAYDGPRVSDMYLAIDQIVMITDLFSSSVHKVILPQDSLLIEFRVILVKELRELYSQQIDQLLEKRRYCDYGILFMRTR